MSIIANNLLQGDEGYNISRSLRFRSSASAYLNRTPASAGNRKTWTWSAWVKLGEIAASNGTIFSAGTTSGESTRFYLRYTGSQFQTGYGSNNLDTTVAVYRDPSAYYHVVLAVDSTQATASNRIKIYVNGIQQTVTTSVNLTLNVDTAVNNTTAHNISREAAISTGYFDGYITEVNFVDGQQLTASSFGETDGITGVWKAKKYGGTYGTNGFYLPFSDNTSTTTLGYDFSGNSNNWTTNNISLTAGTTYDSMVDVPTMSELASNYAVFNPLWRLGGSGYITPTNGNLRASIGGTNNIVASTIPVPSTGKWYMEFTLTTAVYPEFGLCNNSANGGGGASNIFGMYLSLWFANGVYGSHDGNVPDTSGDVGLIAVDVDNNKLWIGRNRSGTAVWMGGGNPSTNTSPSFSASGGGGVYATTFNAQTFNNPFVASGAGSDVWDANFGQQPWVGTPPTGFVALNTFNLPEPSIKAGNKHMDATVYTGNDTTNAIVNSGGFQPDMIWLKNRATGGYDHEIYDVIRGTGDKALVTNGTYAEAVDTGYINLVSFNSNGFTLGATTFTNVINKSGQSHVGWQWKANGTGSSNTAGSITSTVSANPTAGFSVVTYTGTGSNATVGHGLGVAPSMLIIKARNVASRGWMVGNSNLGGWSNLLQLSDSSGYVTDSTVFNGTAPTSSVFSIGTNSQSGANGTNYVAYCWAEIAGFSKFASYTGNGSTDGSFVYCGFRPAFIMIKRSDTGGTDWVTMDYQRLGYNTTDVALNPNASYAENSGYATDFLSNGFKLRTTTSFLNASGGTYIVMAFASNPFKNSLAR